MQKKVDFRPVLIGATHVTENASTSGSFDTDTDGLRYPSRFRTTVPPATSPSKDKTTNKTSDRRMDFQIQHLKALNAELHSKLRLKTAENSQLKLELTKQKSERDKDIRQVQLQQKKTTEMMARTLKHAEDLIKEKELVITKQLGTIGKMASVEKAPDVPKFFRPVPAHGQSFHGRTEASGKPSLPVFARSSSVRSQPIGVRPRTAVSSTPERLMSSIGANLKMFQLASPRPHSTMPCILNLTQKSRVLQKLQEENRTELLATEKDLLTEKPVCISHDRDTFSGTEVSTCLFNG